MALNKKTHVVFFGASVTEQSVHHATGERTGFVNYFIDEFSEKNDFLVSRISAGSSDVMDAGIVYVEKVIALKPDICVLDWVTPSLKECDPKIIQQIYARLLEHDILPVTILLPRTDRVQRDIPIAKEMARICMDFDLPFYDVADRMEGVPYETFLRDVVHTNAVGAKLYAEMLLDILKSVPVHAKILRKPDIPFHVIEVLTAGKVPLSARRLEIKIENPEHGEIDICVVLEQRVGPYSPLINVLVSDHDGEIETSKLETYSIFDPWCHRERQCIKRLTNWHRVESPGRFIVQVINQTPGLASRLKTPPMPANNRHLKPRGSLYIVSDRNLAASAKWS